MRKHLTLAFLLYLCVPISALAATSEIDKSKCSTYTTQENCTGLCTWNTETNTCEMATIITGCVAKFTEETCNADDNCEWVTDDSGNGTCQEKNEDPEELSECADLIADMCNASPGCHLIAGQGCQACPNGKYNSDGTGCTACPEEYPYTTISNGIGATSIDSCFKKCNETCANKTVANGKYSRTEGSPSEAYYGNYCSCTLTCNQSSTSDSCDGYHVAATGATCEPDKSELKETDEYKYFEFTTSATDEPKQYITECKKDDQHFEYRGTKCSTTYGACIDNEHACSDDNTIKNLDKPENITSSVISGNVIWKTENNMWDYSDCTLEGTIITTNNTTTGKHIYKYKNGGWDWESTEITGCISGYYYNQTKDSTQCSQVEAGYYSPGTDTERYACPGGATSNTGATAKTECFINKETQFCNNDGTCFDLSDFGDIKITIK